MSVIIRLQDLPWSASAQDIRNFFKGLTVPAGGVHIIGGDRGDAFIAFSSDEDARQAMMRKFSQLNGAPVQLYLSSKNEMQAVIDEARSTDVPNPGDPSVSGAQEQQQTALTQGQNTQGQEAEQGQAPQSSSASQHTFGTQNASFTQPGPNVQAGTNIQPGPNVQPVQPSTQSGFPPAQQGPSMQMMPPNMPPGLPNMLQRPPMMPHIPADMQLGPPGILQGAIQSHPGPFQQAPPGMPHGPPNMQVQSGVQQGFPGMQAPPIMQGPYGMPQGPPGISQFGPNFQQGRLMCIKYR